MKEKETAVCPCCGGTLQQGKVLFVEHHKRLWENKVKELGLDDLMDNYDYSFGKFFYNAYQHGLRDVQNKPAELIKWEQENPRPQITQTDFVPLLANRVSALEAALAEKGDTV